MAVDNYPRINIRITPAAEKRFKTLKAHGYTAMEVLCIALESCSKIITVRSKKNEELIQFPRNILTKRKGSY